VRLGITGHQDLPSNSVRWIEQRLRALIAQHAPLVGVSSLAKGADQLFAQCVLDAGQNLDAVLPCRDYAEAFDAEDRAAYFALLDRVADTVTLDFGPPSEDAFLAAGKYLARHVDHLLAVWDGEPAQGRGGTADIVAYARSHQIPVTVVWAPGTPRDVPQP
jgi:hypothetical protein